MADDKRVLRPPTRDSHPRVLTRACPFGSARPAVFRSSTYVFSSPEAAEHAFDVISGRAAYCLRMSLYSDLFPLQSSKCGNF